MDPFSLPECREADRASCFFIVSGLRVPEVFFAFTI
jgi:hypothetical protein